MMKIAKPAVVTLMAMALTVFGASAQSLLDAFKGNKAKGQDIINQIGSAISKGTGTQKSAEPADITGTWNYSGPSVAFESSNALQQLGGAAASATIENKLSPYYKRAGLDKMVITFAADNSFVMSLGKIKVTGKVQKQDDGHMLFNFDKVGGIGLQPVKGIVTRSGDTLSVTFDAQRIIQMAQTVSKYINMQSVKTAVQLLQSYDDVYLGFSLKRAN